LPSHEKRRRIGESYLLSLPEVGFSSSLLLEEACSSFQSYLTPPGDGRRGGRGLPSFLPEIREEEERIFFLPCWPGFSFSPLPCGNIYILISFPKAGYAAKK